MKSTYLICKKNKVWSHDFSIYVPISAARNKSQQLRKIYYGRGFMKDISSTVSR